MTIYLKNATYIDWRSLSFRSAHLAVTPGIAGGMEFLDKFPPAENLEPADIVMDCANKLVTKSFGCGHHHIYSTLARGMPAPKENPTNFLEILKYIWWQVDKSLDRDIIEASALAAALYCAKNGVTFVIDHHASPNAVEGSLFTIAQAFDRVGISHLLCYEMSDRDGISSREKGLAETESYLKTGRQGHVGLHASFTVGDTLLKKAVALADKYNTGIHVHVAEALADQDACQSRHQKRIVERFRQAGVLKLSASIFSHCIHLDAAEKELLRNANIWIAQNVESNQNNNVGLAGYAEFDDRVMLGTDGMHSDMLRGAKATFLAGQATEGIDMAGAYKRFRNVHDYIGMHGFSGDGDNNLVILNYNAPTQINQENFLGHFIYGLDAGHVESVISNGRLIVENKQLLTVTEDEILAYAREMGTKLWARLQKI